jgi:hypothetical protein
MENEKSLITPGQQVILSALTSMALSLIVQHLFPDIQSGSHMLNAVEGGLWGLFFSSWLVQFQSVRVLRRLNQKLMASQEALGAPAEAPKVVEAVVDQPAAVGSVEPLVVPVVVEKKAEAVAAPVKKSVVIKKKSKS